jgi:RHS repeat-associated protein
MNMRGKLPAVLLISIALLLPATLSAEVFYYHNDHLGTPLAMTNANGDVVWGANELPFGEHHSGIFLPIGTKVEENDRRFLGKEYDKETGLIYLGQRYLDPATGRFNRPDPVGLVNPSTAEINQEMLHNPQRLNRYVYSLNNPYRFVDPDGLAPHQWADGNYSDSDGQMNPGWDVQVNRAYSQVGQGIAEGWQYHPAIIVGTGLGGGMLNSMKGIAKVGKLAKFSSMLRGAAKGKGNFGIGSATRAEADALGKAWVGKGYQTASDGKTLVSSNKLRQYRPPTYKPKLNKTQANFEQRFEGQKSNMWQSNAHLDIID